MSDRIGFYDRLFKFCIAADSTSNENRSVQSSRENMDWLKETLNEIVTSPIEMVKICVNALEKDATTEEDKDLRLQSIITLNEWLEDIDVTKDFLKLGKFALIESLLKEIDPAIRLEACRLIMCVSQNYEEAQNIICNETKVMSILGDIMQTDSCMDHKSKALSALRCLIENNSELTDRFLSDSIRGYELLELALRSNNGDLQGKAAMIISCIIDSKKKELIERGFIPIIQQTYAKRPWHHSKYLLLQCLYELLKECPEGVAACLKAGLPTQIRSLIASIPEEEDSTADDEIGDKVLRFIENR